MRSSMGSRDIDRNGHLTKGRTAASEAGFTLIELLVVIAMVAVLSAIALPGWLLFTQQQRVSTVNDEIFRAIKEAQSEAKQLRLRRRISFRVNLAGEAEYALHDGDVNVEDVSDLSWKQLGEAQEIQANQILLWTNMVLGEENQITSIGDAYPQPDEEDGEEITIGFDQYGAIEPLPTEADLAEGSAGFRVAVSVPSSSDPDEGVESTSRCVVIKTILGAVQTDQGSDCRPGS
ncbi:MAG: Tfp pilus assembly protein FimT/FimU [Hormoscilla sp.]